MNIKVSSHAFDMARKRLSMNKVSFEKLSNTAFNEGISHGDTKGSLNKFITKLWFKHGKANNIRIYGHNIFFFANNTLVTVYQVPVSMKGYCKIFSDKKQNKENKI